MAQRIQLRRDVKSNWESINPILAEGEIGLETDTYKLKYGDGVTNWNNLDYFGEGSTASYWVDTGDGGIKFPNDNNNYTKIEADGTIINYGNSTTWDDLRINPNTLPQLGANAPIRKIVFNDGVSYTYGNSILLDGANQYAELGTYSNLDVNDNASLSFWIKPTSVNGTILFRENYFQIRKSDSSLVISFDGSWEIWVNNVLIDNTKHHIGISFEKSGSRTRVIVYINNIVKYDNSIWGYSLTGSSKNMFIGSDGTNDFYKGNIDELQFYNKVLTSSEFSELYNNGSGTANVPSTITESTDLVFRFHFDEPDLTKNDSTLGSGYNLTLYNTPTSDDPLIDPTTSPGSIGVMGLAFRPNELNQVFFTAQLPHNYLEGTDIEFHLHYTTKDDNSGNVVFGLEYTWASIGNLFNDTTIIEKTFEIDSSKKNYHNIIDIGNLLGTGKEISSVLTCRLYRKGDDNNDNYDGEVILLEADFHHLINSLGSKKQWSK